MGHYLDHDMYLTGSVEDAVPGMWVLLAKKKGTGKGKAPAAAAAKEDAQALKKVIKMPKAERTAMLAALQAEEVLSDGE